MPARKRRLYWDSCCFIALFNAEPTTPRPQIDALRSTFDEMLAGRHYVITSDLYRVEVFGKDGPDAVAVADQFEACPYFEVVGLRTLAYEMAGDLRMKCQSAKPKRNLKSPDALHIAAGSLARADEIWTTDGDLVRYYEDGLLTGVRVCLPYLLQLKIPF